MATYKERVGTSVVNYAGNYPGAVDGELWYDSTNKNFNYQYENVTTAAWATGGNLNTARFRGAASGNGTQTATLYFGGDTDPPFVALTESYNGSTWTEVGDLNTARDALAGAGTATAALAFGGRQSTTAQAVTESWNGSAWTEVNDLNTAREGVAGTGTTTSALADGGYITDNSALTESYNGTNWTEVGDLNLARNSLGNAGASNTSALAFAGNVDGGGGGRKAETESWNGSN